MSVAAISDTFLREQLVNRRQRLESALAWSSGEPRLAQLLAEVDAALAKMERGTFGICEVCNEPVEAQRLMADPLVRYCLDHLTASERSALERDLEMAAELQRGLLPRAEVRHDGWDIAYAYRPLGPVSGDYCDIVFEEDSKPGLFFFVGDVSGKGVAASMLMAQLHAIFRALVARRLEVAQLVGQASRIFCESSLSPYFATLVGGRAGAGGAVEISNAGHCPPLFLRGHAATRVKPSGAPLGLCSVASESVSRIEPSGLPLGVSPQGAYDAERLSLDPGDVLVIYTDGLSEARNGEGEEYGDERVLSSVRGRAEGGARSVVDGCLQDLARFLGGEGLGDDLTVMAIQRAN
ncbi:MAG TPA: SpoIIE family protein phosphatase [Terriglobia bacterium]|nr:SpoIIE family protein phosphatase [Terriglobia bacterium]